MQVRCEVTEKFTTTVTAAKMMEWVEQLPANALLEPAFEREEGKLKVTAVWWEERNPK